MKSKFNKIISVALLLMMIASIAIPIVTVSAATGTDVIDTFENYENATVQSSWKPTASPAQKEDSVKITVDDTTSAPTRGDGKTNGNYRSLKVDYNIAKEGWGYFRNSTEDPYALKGLEEINTSTGDKANGTYNIWLKADHEMDVDVAIDVKDIPFSAVVHVTTEWKEFKINFRDMHQQADKEPALSNPTINNFMSIIYNGKAGGGLQEFYLIGTKVSFGKERNGDKGTLWMDTISFSGDGISERKELNDGDITTLDRSGPVPANFVADKKPGDVSSSSKPTSSEVADANIKLTNDATKITAEAVLPAGAVLSVLAVTEGDNFTKTQTALMAKDIKDFKLYDISVKNADKDVALTGKAKITMPIPEGYTDPQVYRTETDGTITKIEVTKVENNVAFETDKFGLYSISKLEAKVSEQPSSSTPVETPKSNNMLWIIIGIVAAVVIIGGGAAYYFLVMKKKDNK